MKNCIILIICGFTLLSCSQEEKIPVKSLNDQKILGVWHIDSIGDKNGKNCSFPSLDTWNTLGKSIELEISNDLSVASANSYHYDIVGTYFIGKLGGDIKFTLKELSDYVIRPKSAWQKLCIDNFNNANSYNQINNQLKIYSYSNSYIIFLTKK